ncbi:MAG: MBL fold metallo-hydrolase [Deltaproteobacteria bacterium]|nr:MBL fold metallo-hydrolase [Deltaproteobacteria bacterium]
MFQVTFIGHQGWLFRTASTTVLLDPLLTERFGHGGHLGLVYPPRIVRPEAFPPVDAVVLSHEHDDHFDIPSLERLDRRIPIHLSARSSRASHALLQQMGFSVFPLVPQALLAVGDLRLLPFVADHRATPNSDEWDVLPFVLWDTQGHGSVVSSIDVRMPQSLLDRLPQLVPRPGIWCHANNSTSVAFQNLGGPCLVDEDDTPRLAKVVLARHARLARAWGRPVATLVGGGGWSFGGDRAWIDHHAFPFESERLCESLRTLQPDDSFIAPGPGYTLTLEHGRVVSQSERCAFIEPAPRDQWPSRARALAADPPRDYAPACGRRRLEAGERERLVAELEDYARYLYGSALHRALYSLPAVLEGRSASWGLSLRDDGGDFCVRHDPTGCRFVDGGSEDPQHALASGIEGWGTDLLAFLTGEIGATALCYSGRLRVWNHVPERLRVTPHDLWMYAHPLRRPAVTEALYRRLLAAEPRAVARVRSRSDEPEV